MKTILTTILLAMVITFGITLGTNCEADIAHKAESINATVTCETYCIEDVGSDFGEIINCFVWQHYNCDECIATVDEVCITCNTNCNEMFPGNLIPLIKCMIAQDLECTEE